MGPEKEAQQQPMQPVARQQQPRQLPKLPQSPRQGAQQQQLLLLLPSPPAPKPAPAQQQQPRPGAWQPSEQPAARPQQPRSQQQQ